MKFALIALVAAVSAIRVSAPQQCVSMEDSDKVFDEIDTNGNGSVSASELRTAVTAYLDQNNLHPSSKQVAEFKAAAEKDAGADKVLSKPEFNELANQVANKIAPKYCSA